MAAAKRRRTDYGAAADRTAPTPAPPRPATPAARPPRTKPIRITLDLDPTLYHQLNVWRNRAAADMGLTRVTLAQVLRILGELLLEESDIAEKVQTRIEA